MDKETLLQEIEYKRCQLDNIQAELQHLEELLEEVEYEEEQGAM